MGAFLRTISLTKTSMHMMYLRGDHCTVDLRPFVNVSFRRLSVRSIVFDVFCAGTGQELAQMFGRPVTVVHNPTDSALIDLVECIFAKLWTGQSFATSRPCQLLLDNLEKALKDPHKTKVTFDSPASVSGVSVDCSLPLSDPYA